MPGRRMRKIMSKNKYFKIIELLMEIKKENEQKVEKYEELISDDFNCPVCKHYHNDSVCKSCKRNYRDKFRLRE